MAALYICLGDELQRIFRVRDIIVIVIIVIIIIIFIIFFFFSCLLLLRVLPLGTVEYNFRGGSLS